MSTQSTGIASEDDLATKLIGKVIGEYQIVRYIDRGASALVFEAKQNGTETFAVKVFDPDFLRRFPDDVQIRRIDRQLDLKGRHHEHLIDILGGGLCSTSGLYYLVMPFLPVRSLDKVLDKIPRDSLWLIISQIAAAARFLESLGMCHRDIKPANIAVLGEKLDHAVLLDLGVVRPLGIHNLTDTTYTKEFVGTTQYSPPEFLLRDEDDSADGFRAVTFYQLGAVLHDLIMRRPIFLDKLKPYGRLVRAVLLEEPILDATDVPTPLTRLARLCLLKDPSRRFKSLEWSDFTPRAQRLPTIEEAQQRAERLRVAISDGINPAPNRDSRDRLRIGLAQLRDHIKQACLDDKDTFPPVTVIEHSQAGRAALVKLETAPSSRHGLSQAVIVLFMIDLSDEVAWIFSAQAAVGIQFGELKADISAAPFQPLGDALSEAELAKACVSAAYAAIVAALQETAAGLRSDSTAWIELEGCEDAGTLVDRPE